MSRKPYTLLDFVNQVQVIVDDCAATGTTDDADLLALVLVRLSNVASNRTQAIKARLKGEIAMASVCEAAAERNMGVALAYHEKLEGIILSED